MKRKRRKFTKEFKEDAVKLVLDESYPLKILKYFRSVKKNGSSAILHISAPVFKLIPQDQVCRL